MRLRTANNRARNKRRSPLCSICRQYMVFAYYYGHGARKPKFIAGYYVMEEAYRAIWHSNAVGFWIMASDEDQTVPWYRRSRPNPHIAKHRFTDYERGEYRVLRKINRRKGALITRRVHVCSTA